MLIDKHLMLLSHGFQLLLMKQQSHTEWIHRRLLGIDREKVRRLLGIDREKVRPDILNCQGKKL